MRNSRSCGVLLIGRAFKIAISLPEEICDKEQFLREKETTLKKFHASEREFFGFLTKNLCRDIIFAFFVSGRTFSEKNVFFSQKLLFSGIFSDLVRKNFRASVYFVLQRHQKSKLCARWRFATENKIFQGIVSFHNCFRTLIGKVCTLEKNNWLGCKNFFLCVNRKFIREVFVSESSFVVKFFRTFREIFSNFWQKWFRHGCHHFILRLRGSFSGKKTAKEEVFHCLHVLSKKWTFERKFRGVFRRKVLLSKVFLV